MKLAELFVQFALRMVELYLRVWLRVMEVVFTAIFRGLSAILRQLWLNRHGQNARGLPRRHDPRSRRRTHRKRRRNWQGRP